MLTCVDPDISVRGWRPGYFFQLINVFHREPYGPPSSSMWVPLLLKGPVPVFLRKPLSILVNFQGESLDTSACTGDFLGCYLIRISVVITLGYSLNSKSSQKKNVSDISTRLIRAQVYHKSAIWPFTFNSF